MTRKDPEGPRQTKKDPVRLSKLRQTIQAAFAASSFSSWFFRIPLVAPVKNLNIGHNEDLRPWNNDFMLRSGANIFVSQILVQGRCDRYLNSNSEFPLLSKYCHDLMLLLLGSECSDI